MNSLEEMIRRAQEAAVALREGTAAADAELAAMRLQGAAEGLVEVTCTGDRRVTEVSVDASLLRPDHKGRLESLLVAAFDDAMGKVDAAATAVQQRLADDAGLPLGFL